jgi:hypothetical protein
VEVVYVKHSRRKNTVLRSADGFFCMQVGEDIPTGGVWRSSSVYVRARQAELIGGSAEEAVFVYMW